MAVNKSDVITNKDNLDVLQDKGFNSPKKVVSAHESLAAASDNDIVIFCEVPVDAKLHSIKFASDDAGTTGDINIGFYPGNGDHDNFTDADAVDEDAIGTAIDINAAAVALTEIRFETKAIETINQKAWELAGLSSRPNYETFYICGTLSEATTATADMILIAEYSD